MKKVNPKAVGGFVVGAIILAVVAVIVFGSGRFFQQRSENVAFFSGSLQGLRIGAPVQFRGVDIGTVKDIYIQMDPETLKSVIPVIMEIDLEHIQGLQEAEAKGESRLNELIKLGLRAQLNPQSLVTGQQAVQLTLSPDTPVNLVETDLPYGQIPTIPSRIAQME
ncbi:MAG: MlaD family protein, partial [Candidatus Promineifilaceae bacterium]|nr:MlaD family protein [Candidatus Promineifilaceae bacterium]